MKTYMVGNSLTEDTGVVFNGPQNIASDLKFAMPSGYHVLHSESLTDIVAAPGSFSEVLPSQWNIALPALARDALCFEPYPTGATLGSEATAAQALVASMQSGPSVNPKFFVYGSWPATTSFNPGYQDYWAGAVVDADSTPYTQQLAAVNAVYRRLQTALGASNIWVIPAGDVLNQIDVLARAGSIPGVATVADLYRDTEHLGDVGKYAIGCTVFSTLFRQQANSHGNPATLARYTFSQGPTLTPTIAAQMEAIAWAVVSADPRAMHS